MVNDEKPTVDELRLQIDRLEAIWEAIPFSESVDRLLTRRMKASEKELRAQEAELLRFFMA